jgi:hypothetical protein
MSYRNPPDDPHAADAATTTRARALSADELRRGSPDDIFADFVRHANSEWVASVEAVLSEIAPVSSDDPTDPVINAPEEQVVLLTTPKKARPSAGRVEAARAGVGRVEGLPTEAARARRAGVGVTRVEAARARAGAGFPQPAPHRKRSSKRDIPVPTDAPGAAARDTSCEWTSVIPERSETTQRREAARLVPDVAAVRPPASPTREASEDGLMPSGELDRKLADMDVLLRYGHVAQVQSELDAVRRAYPHDLLLLRRIAELYVARGIKAAALEALFALATGLFERRNIEGMRAALEQVRVLDPNNSRAARLLALLDRRPSSLPPRR